MPTKSGVRLLSTLCLMMLAAGAGAQPEGNSGTTRVLATTVRVDPAQIDAWLALQKNDA